MQNVLLVHGAWHGSWCWSLITEQLAERGIPSVAVDLEGHGLKSRSPVSRWSRPFDPAAFAAEPADGADSTFFRYFPDKADVLFEDDSASHLLLSKAVAGAAQAVGFLGDSLEATLRVARAALLVLADSKAIQALRYPMREQLIAETPQLQVCSLAKERGYIDALEAALADHGASPLTARQAAHVAAACYHTGYTETFSAPELLPAAVDRAFDNLFSIGAPRR